jgi:hypothetical protein
LEGTRVRITGRCRISSGSQYPLEKVGDNHLLGWVESNP